MHGDLRTTSLEQLCRALDQRTATGQLVIEGVSDQITVWFRQGRVVRAAAQGHELRLGDRLVHGGLISPDQLQVALQVQRQSGKPLGEVLVDEGLANRLVVRVFMQEQVLDALFAAVRWTTGTYTFHEEEVPGVAVPTDLTVAQLLFALETRHRVWDEITRTIPDMAAVPEFVPGTNPAEAPLEPGEKAVLTKIDGHRSIAQITDELGFGEYEVAGVVHGLTVLGMVRLGSNTGNGLAPAPAAPHVVGSGDAPATPHVVGSSDAPAAEASTRSALDEAAAFLRGDDPAPAREPAAVEDSPEPAVTFEVTSPDEHVEPIAAAPAPVIPPQPEPAPVDDDADPEPWAFVIGDDDEPAAPARPEPPRERRAPARPITAAVADTATGTPLPAPTPEPEPAPEPAPQPRTEEPAPAAAAPAPPDGPAPEAAPSRPRTGDMSDLLRELRQLSDE